MPDQDQPGLTIPFMVRTSESGLPTQQAGRTLRAEKTQVILTLPALERLIGGDSEVEVAIRQGVVETFTRKYLKSIANLEAIQKARGELEVEMHAAVLDSANQSLGEDFRKERWAGPIVLSAAIKASIAEAAKKAVTASIADEIQEALDSYNFAAVIAAQIDRSVKFRISDGIANRMKEISAQIAAEAKV